LLLASGVASAQPPGDQPPVPPEPVPDQTPTPVPDPTPVAEPPTPVPAPTPAPPPPSQPSEDEILSMANFSPASVSVGGYLQPQFRLRQNSPVQSDQDGFKFARARLIVVGQTHAGNLDLSATVETELQPQFSMLDAYATVSRVFGKSERKALPGKVSLDVGQMRTPISRQQMLSDSRIAFVDKAQIATIAPDRDLGARLTMAPPALPVRVLLGVFNGEGRNQVENINESYLWAARLELSPFGRDAALAEGAFGGKILTVGLSYGHNELSSQAAGHETRTYLGADLFASFKGVSASFEYLVVKYKFKGADPLQPAYNGNGWVAQLNYLLPVKLPPYKQSRLELGARVEEIDRNDLTPISQPGDPNQSVRETTGVLTYYMRMHNLKAQLVFNHFAELEDKSIVGADATYKNDQVILQVTYRME
jgi:hypothetical protein